MPPRLRNSIVLLLTLLVCGAPYQSAACELACGLNTHTPGCHATAPNTGWMKMPGASCAHMATSIEQKPDFNCTDKNCQHPSTWAFEQTQPIAIALPLAHQAIFATASLAIALAPRNLFATGSPPSLSAPLDPILLSIRV
jgi:hypothetical protein